VGPTQINGLPAHVLLVHIVVVLVPLTAVALIGCAVWPSWMRRMGVVLPVLALVTLASVPLTTHAGEWLEGHTASTPLIRKHAELGDGLLPWAVGLFVLAIGLWWWNRRAQATAAGSGAGVAVLATPLRVAAAVLCAVVAAGAVVQVYRIGDSGAKAAWTGDFSDDPASGQHR
jgi:hypothetical protein